MIGRQKYPDGDYVYKSVKSALDNDFANEKDLCDFIERHIKQFAEECLGCEYKSHKREAQVGNKRAKGNRRIDFLIKDKSGQTYIVECKSPKYTSELAGGVGQVLGYLTLLEQEDGVFAKAFIVSDTIDWYLPAIIGRFNLPIGFICMDKSKTLTLKAR